MAQRFGNIRDNRFLSALIMAALTVVLLFGVHTLTTGSGPQEPTTPISIAPTDSSSCIACHTDETVIESMAVLVDDGGHGGEGG